MRYTRLLPISTTVLIVLALAATSVRRISGQTLPEQEHGLLGLKLAQAVVVADFNGDGISDVAAADFLSDAIVVMARGYDGRLTRVASLAAGRGPRSIVVRDFDMDGTADIAVANFFSGDLQMFRGRKGGKFAEPISVQLEPGITSLDSHDVDGDGAPDLIVGNFLSGQISVLTASAGGTFARRTIGQAPGISAVVSRDVNGDGVIDVLAVDASGRNVRLFAGHAGAVFEDAGPVLPLALADDADVSQATAGVTVRAVLGDGQAARGGSVLPDPLVFEVNGLDGDPIAGSPIVFSAIAGVDDAIEGALSTNEDGRAALRVVAARTAQSQFVAAAVPDGGVVVAGALSALTAGDLKEIDVLTGSDERQAAMNLMRLIDGADRPPSDLPRRVINQILLIGIQSPGPNLVVTAVSEPPAVATLKEKFNVTDTTQNQGTDPAAASTTRYYLSVDGVQKTKRLGGGGRDVPALNAGASSQGTDLVTVPITTKPRSYFLLACADDRKVVLEDDETDNCRASTGQIQVRAADLVVTAISEPPANAQEGSTFSVSDTTRNNGDAAANQSTTSYYLSLDNKKSNSDVLVASRTVPSLAPGVSSADTATATVNASPNSYFLLACADAKKKVPEGNANNTAEKNNCLASSGKVTVTPSAPDGGPLTNGALATGRISLAGEVDEWTFAANAGDRISVHIGEIVDNNDFRPWLRLLAPNDTVLANTSGVSATVIDDIVAPATGTYRVHVASFDTGFDGTGTYRLTMTHTPGPITVSPGDQGGPLTNGAIHEGEILQGDVDVWTFTANQGERIAVHIGEINDTDDLRPWIRLWAPNGASLDDVAGVSATVADDIVAPVTGTYLLLVATFDAGFDGEGTYRLTMTKTPGPITVSPGDQGGPLTNGAIHEGQILQGDVDVWTFTANAGERMAIHIGEILDTDDLRPWIRLWAPNGASLDDVAGVSATVMDDIVAPVTGTYLLLVASFDAGFDGEGTYRLTMTKTPGPITVSPGDQGGPLTNGAIHEGQILQGDVDIWTFTANAGERMTVHIGEIADTDDFRPWIRLWAPNGASLDDVAGVSATVADDIVAPVTGTYLLLVATFDAGFDGEGTYRLTMTKTPGPITVSPGDQGGPLTNGAIHEGEILQGDVDVWTFTANQGERIAVHIGEILDTDDFRPWIRLWAPNGASLDDVAGVSATVMDDIVAPVTGTYLLLVASFDAGFDGEGTYRLTMTKTPGPITVSPGDQGGPLTNGAIHEGQILQGDVDVWTFTANAGERIAVHIGEIADTDDFRPWIRLWAPNGATLDDVAGVSATLMDDIVAPVTGTYLLLVASFDAGFDGEGTYRLTMTHTPGPITVSPGDQGGPLTNGGTHNGEILQGDVDVWTITVTAGHEITVAINEVVDNNDYRPWIRLWAPNGATLGDVAGLASAQITGAVAPVTGTYLVLVGSFDAGFDGTGTYSLVVSETPP